MFASGFILINRIGKLSENKNKYVQKINNTFYKIKIETSKS